jgi:hypothetical protein
MGRACSPNGGKQIKYICFVYLNGYFLFRGDENKLLDIQEQNAWGKMDVRTLE